MALLNKLGIPLIVALVGFAAGMIMSQRIQKPVVVPKYECPDCNCPEPLVNVQPFDVNKIKGLREFNYAPEFNGSVQVAGVDSASIRRMIDKSVDKAFQKYMVVDKKKKRSAFGRPIKTNWDSLFRVASKRADSVLDDRIREITYIDKQVFGLE